MQLDFNLRRVVATEFGVAQGRPGDQRYTMLPIDADVQGALLDMVKATLERMHRDTDDPEKFDVAEKHAATEYLYVPLGDELATVLREVHVAENIPVDMDALNDPSSVSAYFVRMTDNVGRRLTGLRRAAQFKGVIEKRLLRFVTNSLKLIDDNVFKLDADFDILIDSVNVHILRPSAFEFAGTLQQAILDAVPTNTRAMKKDLAFVDLDSIEAYASKHPRGARYLASISGRGATKNINKKRLQGLCSNTGVAFTEKSGKLVIEAGSEMAFLEALDRRRYQLELVVGDPEIFRAASRTKLIK